MRSAVMLPLFTLLILGGVALASPLKRADLNTFDYVIVGAGPGGLVTASRLSENPDISVAVIEAGTWAEDVTGNLTTVPGYNGVFDLVATNITSSPIDWNFTTTPQPGILGQVLRYPRGKVLGGSSNLNAMAWSVATVGAFDAWGEEVGDSSWNFDNVIKYYRKAMDFKPPRDTRRQNATPQYQESSISTSGPLSVSYPAYAYSWSTWLAVALNAVGVKNTDAFLDGKLNGSSWQTNTINQTTGERASADRAYLRPYLSRPNLHVFDKTMAEKIEFDGTTATGVRVSATDKTFTLQATREVIVSGGVFQSPQLLQVSGIGPEEVLKAIGVDVVVDVPGVGQNMVDQIFFGINYRVNVPTATTIAANPYNALYFQSNITGPLTNPGGEYAGFEKIPAELRTNFSAVTNQQLARFPADWPEVEYLTLPLYVSNLRSNIQPHDDFNYATILSTLMAPVSRGNLSISSSSMHDQPLINPNWLTNTSDIELAIAMFKRLRQVWGVSELDALRIGDEYFPGASIQTDEEILAHIRQNLIPVSHAVGTNKMGPKDSARAVVDPSGLVYKTQKLRVVDASIFPFLPPGTAPQATTYMLAEKIADDIKGTWE